MGPILASLSLLLPLCGGAYAQQGAPKPAGMLPEAQQWIRDHAGDAEQGAWLSERLRGAKTIVVADVGASQPVSARLVLRCLDALLARDEPPLLCLPSEWDEMRKVDAWLANGQGTFASPLGPAELAPARAWNSDEKHARKVRAAGIDYRATREEALGLVEFVTRIDPQLDQRASQLLGPFRQTGADGRHRYDKVDENWRFSVRQLLSDLFEQAGERREAWEGIVGPAGYHAGVRNLRRLTQAEQEISKPDEFRRGRALCQNAAAAREELAPGAALIAWLPVCTQLESQEVHEALGADALLVLLLTEAGGADHVALKGLRPSGAIDLREVPKTGLVANWFAEHFGKRADLLVWKCEQ